MRPGIPGASGQVLRLLAEGRKVRPVFLARLAWSYLHAGPRRADPRGRAGQVHAPTLSLEGADDDVVRSRALEVLQGQLPNARLIRVPGASHALIDGQARNPARLVRALALLSHPRSPRRSPCPPPTFPPSRSPRAC